MLVNIQIEGQKLSYYSKTCFGGLNTYNPITVDIEKVKMSHQITHHSKDAKERSEDSFNEEMKRHCLST